MTSKDKKTRKTCENAALSIFTFSQIHSWMKRAKVFACWKGAFTSYEASRRLSEDHHPTEQLMEHKAKTFYILPRRREMMTLEQTWITDDQEDDIEDNESKSLCPDQYYLKQYRKSIDQVHQFP